MNIKTLTSIALTALAPCLWGASYIVFTQTLPVDHPLMVAVVRALPAGLILMLAGAGLPRRDKLLPLMVLGCANIGIFFGLLFVSASRLPGGVAATLTSLQPLIVVFLAWLILYRRPRPAQIAAALAGILGVALLVLDPSAALDAVGMLAAIGGALSMAVGTVLIARWGSIGKPLQIAAWQLALGGLVLLPVALVIEGLPPRPDMTSLLGLAYLVPIGTAFSYWLWVRGIGILGPDAALLSPLSPLVATLLGAFLLGEWLSLQQWIGVAVILTATLVAMVLTRRKMPQ